MQPAKVHPALRLEGLDTHEPAFAEDDALQLCAELGCTELVRVLVPRDNRAFVNGKRNSNYGRGRGFVVVLFDSNASAADAIVKLDGLLHNNARLSATWDRLSPRAPADADGLARAAGKLLLASPEKPKMQLVEPPPASAVEYPALPQPNARRTPPTVAKPALHIIKTKDAASDTASTTSAMSSMAGVFCFFCKGEGHMVADCAQLQMRRCQACGELGHTEKRCAMMKSRSVVCEPIGPVNNFESPTTEIFELFW
jgi:hypothetical protein